MAEGILKFVFALVKRGVLLFFAVLVEGSSEQVLKDKVVILLFLLLRWEFLLVQTKMCWLFVEKFLSCDGPFFFQLSSQNILYSLLILILLFPLLFLLRLRVILHIDAIEVVIQGIDNIRLQHAFLPTLFVETAHVKRFNRFSLFYLL